MSARKKDWGAILLVLVVVAVLCAILFVNVQCSWCGGAGKYEERKALSPCTHCHGEGFISLHFRTAVKENNTRVCPQCNGAGRITAGTTRMCPACGGQGKMPLYKRIARLFSPGTGS